MKHIMIVTDSTEAIEKVLLYGSSIVFADAALAITLPLKTSIVSIEAVKTI